MPGPPGRESANSLLAFGSQLKLFFLGKQGASQGCAGCTLHIPRMCHSIDIIDLHIFMTIFQQLLSSVLRKGNLLCWFIKWCHMGWQWSCWEASPNSAQVQCPSHQLQKDPVLPLPSHRPHFILNACLLVFSILDDQLCAGRVCVLSNNVPCTDKGTWPTAGSMVFGEWMSNIFWASPMLLPKWTESLA